MQIALDNYHSMSAKTRAAGMLACTLPSCTDKCASTKVENVKTMFRGRFQPEKALIIGSGGIDFNTFFRMNLKDLF